MVASKSAQTATPDVGSRARVTARARNRIRKPVEGGFVRSRYAPASETSVAAAAALLDRHRAGLIAAPEPERHWGRKLLAGLGALALTAFTGVFLAALVAGSMAAMIVAILNIHR